MSDEMSRYDEWLHKASSVRDEAMQMPSDTQEEKMQRAVTMMRGMQHIGPPPLPAWLIIGLDGDSLDVEHDIPEDGG